MKLMVSMKIDLEVAEGETVVLVVPHRLVSNAILVAGGVVYYSAGVCRMSAEGYAESNPRQGQRGHQRSSQKLSRRP